MHLLLAVVVLLFASQQPNRKPQDSQQSTTADKRGTQDSPLVVKVTPTPKTPEEAEQESQDRKNKADNDRNLVNATWVLAGIGVLQLIVFGLQAAMLKRTVQSGTEQSAAMDRHIGETTRSANAMETIANTIEDGNQMIMRAYVIVTIGTAIFQERRVGQSDLKFEGKATVQNTGNTPARKVRMYKQAAILPFPIPPDFTYPIPQDNAEDLTYATVGAHQSYLVSSIVPDFVPDGEVAAIKEGTKKVLCMWGLIKYEDIFGKPHTTKFAQWLTWLPNQTVFGYYVPGQNESD